ncbi:hypothetical protein DL769_005147 [Monosporascus sp. CRB-8-3]|nr:hypothetical protein DL769_005147 [Monosporascus sp. CRB-8-3]
MAVRLVSDNSRLLVFAEDAQELFDFPEFKGRACLAAINSLASVTLSGDRDAIEELKIIFEDEEKFTRILKVVMAYHSHHMAACSDAYLESLAGLDIQVGRGRHSVWFSSVDGGDISGKSELLKGRYWDSNMTIPYTGQFNRGSSAVQSFADGLGYVLTQLGKGSVNLHDYDQSVSGKSAFRLAKGLLTYAWNHDNEYWHEPRYARAVRMRPGPVQELLGHMTLDSSEQDMRWRRLLRSTGVPWLSGHQLQCQVAFPAAGYVVMALEAAMILCQDLPPTLIEVLNIDIGRALSFDSDTSSVETIFSITDVLRQGVSTIEAGSKCNAALGKYADKLELLASGRVQITLGEPSMNALPKRLPQPPNLIKVHANKFYSSLQKLGYQYTGPFAALEMLGRKLGAATGRISNLEPSGLMLHPAVLDAAFQSTLLTYAAPGDGRFSSLHVPRRIGSVTVNPGGLDHATIQVQGLECVPFARETAQDDKELFSTVVWDVAAPDVQFANHGEFENLPTQDELGCLLERTAAFYLRTPEKGNRPRYIVEIATGVKSSIEIGTRDDLLGRYYSNGRGLAAYTGFLARTVKQIAHRYARMNILEVGAGTGACTKAIFQEIGGTFSSYTFTDISPGFSYSAKAWAQSNFEKMMFKTFDVGQDPGSQGLAEQSYDLVVASLVLHATPSLEQTLRNTRRLLKPGGHLIVLEVLPTNFIHYGTMFGAFSGWWLGAQEGRVLTPAVTEAEWNELLLKTGFSGCETISPKVDHIMIPIVVFASQAVDDRIRFLRKPLSSVPELFRSGTAIQDLVIVGCDRARTAVLVDQLKSLLDQYCGSILQGAGTLVWVTQGRCPDNPHSSILVGLVRSAVREIPSLDYLFLDIECDRDIDAHNIAEALLRHKAATQWRAQESISITAEPELVLDKGGRFLIPRLLTCKEMNDRYNSLKRLITAPPSSGSLRIVAFDSGYVMEQERPPSRFDRIGLRIRVTYSVLSAVRVAEFGHMFLILGKDCNSGDQVVALSIEHTSVAQPWGDLFVAVKTELGTEARLRESLDTLFGKKSWAPWASNLEEVRGRLETTTARACHALSETRVSRQDICSESVTLEALPELKDEVTPCTVIDWTSTSGVLTKVKPAASLITFSNERTYWLAGLTGGLGLSLCEWMIRHGARNVVISSRSPRIDVSWLEEMRALGAVVKVASCDITKKEEVVLLHADICSSMPPIAGVAQDANETTIFADATMRSGGYTATSEYDFHQLFAEAVLPGRPGYFAPVEILTGLQKADSNLGDLPVWESDPIMGHFIRHRELHQSSTSDAVKIPVKTRLAEAQTVEIRSWFMKTLEVNIPVLRILNGVIVEEVGSRDLMSLPRTTDSSDMRDGTLHSTSNSSSSSVKPDLEFFDEKQLTTSSDSAIQKFSRLSFSQEMFWFVWEFLQDKTSLNHTGWARMTGEVRVGELQCAVRAMGQQHESLRACFFERDGKPVQGIMETSMLKLECRHIREEEEVSRTAEALRNDTFDVARGKTMRLVLLSRLPIEHFLVFGIHPLAMDGLSFQIFLDQLMDHYAHPHLRPSTRQFLEYSEKQYVDLEAGNFDRELRFWKAELATLPPPLPILSLSTAVSRPDLAAHQNERAILRIDAKTKMQIQVVCRRYKATPFHFYLASFRALLLRYATDVEDVSIGIGDANRTEDEMMDVIGPFINLLPVRLRTEVSAKFELLLQDARTKTYAALANPKVPFQVLLSKLNVPRSSTYTSLFQCFIDYRQGQREKTSWGDVHMQFESFESPKLAYDVALDIVDDPNGECVHILEVRKELYGKAGAERLVKSYECLVKAFVAEPGLALDEPGIFEPAEIEEVIRFSQGPSFSSQWPETVVHRIDEVTLLRQNESAVRHPDNTTTLYATLSNRANAIAVALQVAGIRPGSPVAVLQEATHNWISSILGIWHSGAVYLPLDLGLPWARLAAMVQDCQPDVVLVDEYTGQDIDKLGKPGIKVIDVSTLACKMPRVPISAQAEGTAVILYTSGSTGTPKGILLKHEGLRNWAEAVAQLFNLQSEIVLQQTSSTFDLSLIQILTALCHGGSLCLVPWRQRGDAIAVSDIMAKHNVTFTCATPSEYLSWPNYGRQGLLQCTEWRTAFCAGESIAELLPEQLSSLGKSELRFYNLYGPSETSLAATAMQVPLPSEEDRASDVSRPIAAGRPLPNYSVGDDRTRGWTTLHRTGDIGRWRNAGTLLIEGRIAGDSQVKLRGLRIDLSEVEHAIIIAAKGALFEAVVSVRRSSPESPATLIAHVVFDRASRNDDLSQHISTILSRLENLPQYMRPAALVPVDHLPKTNSAKLNRKAVAALPLPESARVECLENPTELTATEIRLRSIWEEVIADQPSAAHGRLIMPETDFFHVGGSSLLLLRLQARIREVLSVEIPIIRMFGYSTLAAMARRIDDSNKQDKAVDAKVVVLTGATGYLGRALLNALVADPNVKRIHCIGVRHAASRHDLFALEKEAERVFAEAHLIIHNGAEVSYLKTYASLRACNLQSTKELVEMCAPHTVPIHYISTVSVGHVVAEAGKTTASSCDPDSPKQKDFVFSPVSAAAYKPALHSPGDGSANTAHGYTASKWASERFLERLNERYSDWPIWIHRPSLIARQHTEAGDAPGLELVENIRHYSALMHAIPVVAGGRLSGALNLVPLDVAVKGILDVALGGESSEQEAKRVHFLHHLGDEELRLEGLRKWAIEGGIREDQEGQAGAAGEIELAEWVLRAAKLGMNATLVAMIEHLAAAGGRIVVPRVVR